MIYFFFSSRRRHTRFDCDWSSDVCSSDLCGKCRFCVSGRPVLCLEQGKALTTPREGTPRVRDAKGEALNIFSGCGAMAEYATVSAENLIKVDAKIPFECAALVGCGVTTGVGA